MARDQAMKRENHAEQITTFKRQLHFHNERGKTVETDPELTAEDRTRNLAYHEWVMDRLRGRLIDLEGH